MHVKEIGKERVAARIAMLGGRASETALRRRQQGGYARAVKEKRESHHCITKMQSYA